MNEEWVCSWLQLKLSQQKKETDKQRYYKALYAVGEALI